MKKLLPAIVAGFIGGVFTIAPLVKSLSCCLLIPFVSVLALYLDMKSNKRTEPFELSNGVVIGLLTGIFAALFGFIFDTFITLITHTNDLVISFSQMPEMMKEFPFNEETKAAALGMIEKIVNQIKEDGFSLIYSIGLLFNGLIANSIFGMIGGLIGVKFLNHKYFTKD